MNRSGKPVSDGRTESERTRFFVQQTFQNLDQTVDSSALRIDMHGQPHVPVALESEYAISDAQTFRKVPAVEPRMPERHDARSTSAIVARPPKRAPEFQ